MTSSNHALVANSKNGRPWMAVLGAIPNLLTLLAFVAIWLIGHKTHWTVPKFSELFGDSHGPTEHSSMEVAGASEAKESEAKAKPDLGSENAVAKVAAAEVVPFDSESDIKVNGVTVTPATVQTVHDEVIATAVVDYDEHKVAQVSSRVPGHVFAICKRLGESVKKGEPLAIIDSEMIGRAKAELLQTIVAEEHKRTTFDRMKSAEDVIASRSLQEAEAEWKEAELARFTALQKLANLGFDIPTGELVGLEPKELAERVRLIGLPQDVLSKLAEKPTTANLFALVAPFDGIVTQQEVVVGEMVHDNQTPFVVADVSTMWVRLSVAKEDADKLELGQKVSFSAPGIETQTGVLTWISTEIDDKTRTVQARCEVANSTANGLRANLFGEARVRVREFESAIVVPSNAIQRLPDGTPVIFVRQPGTLNFEARKVAIGLSSFGKTQIVRGVSEGDAVVEGGSFVLKSELMKSSLVGG